MVNISKFVAGLKSQSKRPVYHGAAGRFREFKPEYIGSGFGQGYEGYGYNFTSLKEHAYSFRKGGSGSVYSVDLDLADDELLDLNALVAEQPSRVRAGVKKAILETPWSAEVEDLLGVDREVWDSASASKRLQLVQDNNVDGDGLLYILGGYSSAAGTPLEVIRRGSERLSRHGVAGTTARWGARKASGEMPDANYVVFPGYESRIQIKTIDGIPIADYERRTGIKLTQALAGLGLGGGALASEAAGSIRARDPSLAERALAAEERLRSDALRTIEPWRDARTMREQLVDVITSLKHTGREMLPFVGATQPRGTGGGVPIPGTQMEIRPGQGGLDVTDFIAPGVGKAIKALPFFFFRGARETGEGVARQGFEEFVEDLEMQAAERLADKIETPSALAHELESLKGAREKITGSSELGYQLDRSAAIQHQKMLRGAAPSLREAHERIVQDVTLDDLVDALRSGEVERMVPTSRAKLRGDLPREINIGTYSAAREGTHAISSGEGLVPTTPEMRQFVLEQVSELGHLPEEQFEDAAVDFATIFQSRGEVEGAQAILQELPAGPRTTHLLTRLEERRQQFFAVEDADAAAAQLDPEHVMGGQHFETTEAGQVLERGEWFRGVSEDMAALPWTASVERAEITSAVRDELANMNIADTIEVFQSVPLHSEVGRLVREHLEGLNYEPEFMRGLMPVLADIAGTPAGRTELYPRAMEEIRRLDLNSLQDVMMDFGESSRIAAALKRVLLHEISSGGGPVFPRVVAIDYMLGFLDRTQLDAYIAANPANRQRVVDSLRTLGLPADQIPGQSIHGMVEE